MYFRCADCLTATWTSVVRAGKLAPSIECGGCGRRYVPDPVEELGSSMRTHYTRAVAFAKAQELDMASAYAVLLGIMSIDQALVLSQVGAPDESETAPQDEVRDAETSVVEKPVAERAVVEPAPARPADRNIQPVPDKAADRDAPARGALADEALAPEVDPGFLPAIRAGRLTKSQAIERGNRKVFAARLVQAHGLSRRLAYLVADNRLSLGQAKRRMSEPRRPKFAPRGVTKMQMTLAIGLVLVVTAALCWHLAWESHVVDRSRRPVASAQGPGVEAGSGATPAVKLAEPQARQTVLKRSTVARRDQEGKLVEIAGPDPSSVLLAYCDGVAGGPPMEPVELTSDGTGSHDSRLGVFRDPADWNTLQMIRIRRDRKTGRWVAGDGKRPIYVAPLPELPPKATRFPVEVR